MGCRMDLLIEVFESLYRLEQIGIIARFVWVPLSMCWADRGMRRQIIWHKKKSIEEARA